MRFVRPPPRSPQPHLRRDAILGPASADLVKALVDQAVIDALSPYGRASLSSMAVRLSLAEEDLVAIVERLIGSRRIPARLDAAAGVLVAVHADARASALAKAEALCEAMASTTRQVLFQASLVQEGFMLRAPKKHGGRTGDGLSSRGGRSDDAGGGSKRARGGRAS